MVELVRKNKNRLEKTSKDSKQIRETVNVTKVEIDEVSNFSVENRSVSRIVDHKNKDTEALMVHAQEGFSSKVKADYKNN